MPKHHIRLAQSSDASAICYVVRTSITECCTLDHRNDAQLLQQWLANKTEANTLRWLANPASHAFVAEQEGQKGQIVGFALRQNEEVMLCYILPQVRFQGVGKALLQALEQSARAEGLTALQLESTVTAQDFYRRNGFSQCGAVEVSFGMEGLPMRKELAS